MKVKSKQMGRERAGTTGESRYPVAKGIYCSFVEGEFSSQHPCRVACKRPVTSSGRSHFLFWPPQAPPLTDITTCTQRKRVKKQSIGLPPHCKFWHYRCAPPYLVYVVLGSNRGLDAHQANISPIKLYCQPQYL